MENKQETQKTLDILVVEDTKIQQEAARQLLKDHNVTIVATFDEAADLISEPKFGSPEGTQKKRYDAVLTDMFLTEGRGDILGNDPENRAKARIEMPFGYAIALMACKEKIPYVAILSEVNHHLNPIAYTMDFFRDIILHVGSSMLTVINSAYLKQQAYVKKDGTITRVDPFDLANDSPERTEFVRNDESGFESVKNWKAALDYVMSGEIWVPPAYKT